ncbi:MAG: cytochrome b/b6 domain-containing protein [Syntrophorhabdales bacterium]|jgi:thiosulfate reductase cytochrome b subunit
MRHVELHRLTLRIWHWVNTVLIFLLILTGVRLRIPEIRFLFAYRNDVLIHRWMGLAACVSFLFWLAYSLVSGNIARNYAFRPARDVKGMVRQGLYYAVGFFRGWPNPYPTTPREKFNPLQKVAYTGVMFLLTPLTVVTGILFSNIPYFRGIISYVGGTRVLDAIHVIGGYLFVIYLIVHVYMATLGPTPFTHIKAMFTGYEEEPETKKGGPMSVSPMLKADTRPD